MSLDPTDVSAAIDCDEVVRSLDAYLDRELAEPEQAELEAHLSACPTCGTQVDTERRVRTALRARLRSALGSGTAAAHAPRELRDRIHLALARERRPAWRRMFAPLPLAALAACAAGVLLVLYTHGGIDPLVEEAVQKHARDLPLEVTAASMGPDSIAHWFAGKLDFNPTPPQFRGAEVRLVGARLSHIQDRPAAYVRYDLPRGHLGLFILDDPHRRFYDELGRLVHAGPASLRVINARGFNVAVWRRNELVYSLVSDLDEPDLAKLVQAAQVATER